MHTPKQIEAIVVKNTAAAAADDNPGKRAGFQEAVGIFNCLKRRWSYSESLLTRQHNMFYSLLDTTSLWILATWLSKGSPNKMRGPRLLSHLCNAVVVGNSWRRLRHLPGPSGFPARITASEYLKLHMQATASTEADPAFQGDVVPSPPGGIKGTDRHSLDHLASTLGFFVQLEKNRTTSPVHSTWSTLSRRVRPRGPS